MTITTASSTNPTAHSRELVALHAGGGEALLAFHSVSVAGEDVVVLGRGPTLGRPFAAIRAQTRPTSDAAETVVDTGVPDWRAHACRADVPVAAAGVPRPARTSSRER